MIKGYKAFDENLQNRYKNQFEIGKIYHCFGDAVYGNNGNGYHFCLKLEDTLRYVDAINGEVKIVAVLGYGNIVKYDDEYNEYYDMYAATSIELLHELSREDIIDYVKNISPYRVKRFIQGYKLTEEEIKFFKNKYYNDSEIIDAIAYYQENNYEVYKKRL